LTLNFRPIDGVSTYNVIPFEAGQYFNKIQCFCFEEQRLNPGEEVIKVLEIAGSSVADPGSGAFLPP
jgi:cytochrome c oxidase assembly protein Cox11